MFILQLNIKIFLFINLLSIQKDIGIIPIFFYLLLMPFRPPDYTVDKIHFGQSLPPTHHPLLYVMILETYLFCIEEYKFHLKFYYCNFLTY